jgi:phosphatidylglycerol---prolipoprotein diacylglyceryl transferase
VIAFPTFPSIEIGPINLHTFGLFVALGVIVGASIAAKRNMRYGVPRELTERAAFIFVIAGLIGARLTWVLTNLERIDSPLDVIAVWEGGLQFSGGFIAALLVAPYATRGIQKGNRFNLVDGAAVGLAVGQMIGRCGCMSVGEHLGHSTDFFLGWKYTGGTTREGPLEVGQTYHNASLYEFLWLMPIIGVMLWLDRRGSKPGVLTGFFLVSYGVLRFLTDFLRAYDTLLFGLTGAQYMCLVIIPVGVVILIRARAGRYVNQQTQEPLTP